MENSFKKTLIKIIALIVEVLFAIGIVNIICSWSESAKNNLAANYISIILFAIYTFILVEKIFIKKNRNCMRAMKHFCSYNKVKELIKDEEFKEVKNCGAESVYASKLWLNLGGALVPKNFITGAYVQVATYGVFELRIILINGKQIFYRIGPDKNIIERTINSFISLVPHMTLCDDVFNRDKDFFNSIASNYKEKIKDGVNVEELINNWSGEFAIK